MKSDNKSLHVLAQNLRNNSTLAESVLWKHLRNKQAQGFRFRRQTVFGKYIVDFYCPRLKLVIEIDGSSHNDKYEYDRERDEYLQSLGLTVLHLDNSEILHHISAGLFAIDTFMQHQKNILKK